MWWNLSVTLRCGGISGEPSSCVIDGKQYSALECYQKVLEIDERFARAWKGLAMLGGGQVGEKIYSATDCHAKFLELEPEDAYGWVYFAIDGGGKLMNGEHYTIEHCLRKARRFNPEIQLFKGIPGIYQAAKTVKDMRNNGFSCINLHKSALSYMTISAV